MLKQTCYKLWDMLLQREAIAPQVITLMDGGICSQMHQYLLGQLYERNGYATSYDTSFYTNGGKDMNARFVRNFDIEKAFPYIRIKAASTEAIKRYKKRYYYPGNNSGGRINDFSFLDKTPPLYLGGYYHLQPEVWLPAFHAIFKICPEVLDAPNQKLREEILSRPNSVAVHVRRGDLAVELQAYGKPASNDYFHKAVSYLQSRTESPYFYFFSDEPLWVVNELIPQLNTGGRHHIVDINGSDKGYMDLIQIASCHHQITSKGSLGKFGAVLGDNERKIVTLCDDQVERHWEELLQNPVFI